MDPAHAPAMGGSVILCDERVGSCGFPPLIRKYGVDADIGGKLAGDFEFVGNGPDGPILCGFERKELQDLLNSMRDGRLAGSQCRPMIETYERRYLIVEGIWRRGPETGLVETPSFDQTERKRIWKPCRGQFRFAEVTRFLTSMRELGGFVVYRTSSQEETASYIAEEFYWWSKEWVDHKTHQTLYAPEMTQPKSNGHKPASIWRKDPTLLELWLSQLPGIDSRAIEIATNFSSAIDMAMANIGRWTSIKGIGKETARKIVAKISETTEDTQ